MFQIKETGFSFNVDLKRHAALYLALTTVVSRINFYHIDAHEEHIMHVTC